MESNKQTIIIPVLKNAKFDLTQFDFSFKEIKILNIESEEFKSFIKSFDTSEENYLFKFFEEIIEEKEDYDGDYFVVVKNNPIERFNYTEILNVWKILLIIHPSNLYVKYEVHLDIDDDIINRHMVEYPSIYAEDYFFSEEKLLPEINKYIKLVFDRLNQTNYLGLIIEHYLISYRTSHVHFEYLTLCMALESVISGNNELVYRIQRNISILCGLDELTSDRIFNNLKKIYSLRSKIIHGEPFDSKKIEDYMPYLKNLVSRMIIELLIHNYSNNQDLGNQITKIAFGERYRISEKWEHYNLNPPVLMKVNYETLS